MIELYKDVLPKIEEYRTVLRNSAVLFISHKGCLDGIGSVIIAEKYFPNFTCVTVGYDCIDDFIRKLTNEKFKTVFLVDICPKDTTVLDKFDRAIVLDHHESVIHNHNPKNDVLIYDNECGTKLMKRFTELVLKKELPELNDFTEAVNDYDMWIHKKQYGKFLQFLFYEIGEINFKFEAMNLSLEELYFKYEGIYQDHLQKIEDYWNSLEIEEIDCRYRVAHFSADNYINDLCDRVLRQEGYDIAICHKKNNLHSIRVNQNTDFDSGSLLSKLGIGGGHPKASAFKATNNSEYYTNLKLIIDEIGPF